MTEFQGEVTNVGPDGLFIINCENKTEVKCSLADFMPMNSQWTTNVLDTLKKFILNKRVSGMCASTYVCMYKRV